MRSLDIQQLGMFSYVSVDQRVPLDHPIRKLRVLVDMVDTILGELDGLLGERYAQGGRPSIPPERILRASLLQVVYSVRSERLLMEQLNYNLLFRWFVGLNIDDPVWDHSTFSFNRQRLFDEAIAQQFFEHTVLLSRMRELISDEHFSVDGTLLDAWASHKSFRPKNDDDEGDGGDFRGQRRRNDTHGSTTDPDTRLMRKSKGKEAKLSYLANSLMENRHGLVVGIDVRDASGTGEGFTPDFTVTRARCRRRWRALAAIPSARRSTNASSRVSAGSTRSAGCANCHGWRCPKYAAG